MVYMNNVFIGAIRYYAYKSGYPDRYKVHSL